MQLFYWNNNCLYRLENQTLYYLSMDNMENEFSEVEIDYEFNWKNIILDNDFDNPVRIVEIYN